MKNNSKDALDFLYSHVDYEKKAPGRYGREEYNLDNFRSLLRKLGDPQNKIKTVLVAGTKGKGSSAAILASILGAAGYKTGLYTSPHLVSVRERISICGRPISGKDFADVVFEIKDKILGRREKTGDYRTVFEILTAAAFLYFNKKKTDIAVIECGLGGRLDATNVLSPLVSVITPISLDHCDLLGNSLLKIAGEKGGIIKEKGAAVISKQPVGVLAELKKIAAIKKSRLFETPKIFKAENVRLSEKGSFFDLAGKNYNNFCIPLAGAHQIDNALTAMTVVSVLREFHGFDILERSIREGLKSVKWSGRLETIRKSPRVVLDGAHNAASARVLSESLRKIYDHKKSVLVLGISANKDIKGIVRELAPRVDEIFITKSFSARAAEPETIERECLKYKREVTVERDPKKALERAVIAAGKNGLVCVTGSLYLVGDILSSARL